MPQSYGQTWRAVRLYYPAVPALLIQRMVRDTYRELLDERNWSFLRGEGEILLNPSKTGNVNLVQGSAVVATTAPGDPLGMVFAASDAGRQIRFGSGPPLTILSVDASLTFVTLERVWDGPSTNPANIIVSDCYVILPIDFGHFIAVVDPQFNRLVRIFVTEQELNSADPGRYNKGQPWALFNYRLSTLAATLGRVQYEMWPYWEGTASIRFPYYYVKRPSDPADDDLFLGPLRDRGDVIELGARAKAAMWPGTTDNPNPGFNLNLAGVLEKKFAYEEGLLEVKDEETYMTWLQDQWWARYHLEGYGIGPIDAAYMQSHE